MNRRFTRVLSALILFALLTSLLGMQTFAADPTVAVAVNSQSRHTVCTALSADARAYYSGEYRYENLKTLRGVDSTDSYAATQNNPLYSKLYDLMSSTRNSTVVKYGGYTADSLATYWDYTDAVAGERGYQYFYTDVSSSSQSFAMNREHIWPQSKASYFQLNGGADLHHLRPSVEGVNMSKSNRAFANLVGTETEYSAYQVNNVDVIWTGSKDFDNVLEVRDNVKGDVARILLYVYVRWQQPNLYSDVESSKLPPLDADDSSDTGVRIIEDRATLLQWCKEDPVDAWEMERNDLVQDVQGNRNVFIDYPELAWYMFGLTPPSDMQTPSGDAAGSGTSATVTAVSSDPACGTVSVSGNVITAFQHDGYYPSGYTVTSGVASVTQDGSTFTVTAETDCTVRIEFAAKESAVLTFSVPSGVTQSTMRGYVGDSVVLPLPSGTPTDSKYTYSFVGWVASETAETTAAPTYYAAGSEYALTESTTLYALYSYTVGSSDAKSVFSLVSQAPDDWSGEYVIVNTAKQYAMNSALTDGKFGATAVTVTDDTVVNPDASIIFTFKKEKNGSYSIHGTNGYLKISADSSKAGAVTETAEDTFTVTLKGGVWQLISATTANRCFAYYTNGNDFRTYACSTYKTGHLFRKIDGASATTTYLTLSAESCRHSDTVLKNAREATCTSAGYTGDLVCTACNAVVKAGTILDPLGHTEVIDAAVAATCTTAGKTEGKHCSVCNTVLVAQTVLPATGHSFSYRDNDDGTHTTTCSNSGCDYSATKEHVFKDGTCPCGATEQTGPIEVAQMTIGTSLSLNSDLSINFRVKNVSAETYDLSTAYLTVEKDMYPAGQEMFVSTTTIEKHTLSANGRLVFTYAGIAAAEMNDEVRATFYVKGLDGKLYCSPVMVTSICGYVKTMLASETCTEALRTCLIDMLNYGTAAQLYFGRHTDALANAEFEEYQQYASTGLVTEVVSVRDTIASGCTNNLVSKFGSALDVNTSVGIKFTLTGVNNFTTEDLARMKLVVKDEAGNVLDTVEGSNLSVDARGRIVGKTFVLTARQMRTPVYATLYCDGEAASDTFVYSIASYLIDVQTYQLGNALESLITAMIIYGDAADKSL